MSMDEPTIPNVRLPDVTLREHGQNVTVEGLRRFTPGERASFACSLASAGVRRLEILSCVHPRVAPAMATAEVEATLRAIGDLDGVEIVTLVPNERGYRSFQDLGLGPEGRGHTVGVFHSAMDEHNVANLGRTVAETSTAIAGIAGRAAADSVRLSAYVSAAFGYDDDGRFIGVPDERLCDQVRRLFDLGAVMVTLSDLQGLADDDETARVWDRVLGLEGGAYASRLGYHPHHADPERAVDRVEAAWRAGVRCFDASVRAAGGCVTGAPGNAPAGRVLARLDALGADSGIDTAAVAALVPAWL